MRTGLFLQTYAVSLVAFLVLDLAWLGLIARGFYRQQLGHLLSPDVRWSAAIVFYLLFVAAVVVFAVLPAVERGSLGKALLLGGFFGLVAYATYDLTNLATLRGFPTLVAAVDMTWGCVLTAAVAALGYLFARQAGSAA
ncbi:MAG: DUF2177 family protein [Gemmatimonadota bacterium]|nr:MAG: DUF2177 family protein [Gemmatimonadota bacterium]